MSNWQNYTSSFRKLALSYNYDETEVRICLNYAHPLFEKNLPIIFDQEHLSHLVGYQLDYLIGAIYNTEAFYRYFTVDKRSGGVRKIAEPLPSLKEIQRWILDNILYKCPISRFTKGYVPTLSIRDNARFHRNQELVLKLDIKDFFPSIKSGRVFNFFKRLGYQKAVSQMLTNLCTLNGSLPQGAPTSPALSNLIISRLDTRLSHYAIQKKIRYTRYADDMTFSGSFAPGEIIKLVRIASEDEGLILNERKIRLMKKHQRQIVTGVVVNEKLQAPRERRREFRKTMYFIKKFGIDSHISAIGNNKSNYLKHLLGVANHILHLNPKDKEVRENIELLHKIFKDSQNNAL